MSVSISSVLALIFWGNIMILILYAACSIPRILNRMNCRFMIWLLCLIFLRFLFPVEISHSITVPVSKILPVITDFIRLRRLTIAGHSLYVYQLLLFIWLCGSCALFIRMLWNYHRFRNIKKLLLSHSEPVSAAELPEEIALRGISVYKSSLVGTPMISGIVKPVIFLPNIPFTLEETSFILQHELQHAKYKDTLLKSCMKICCILYWWNPAIYLLQKQLLLLLEMRADSEICENLDDTAKISYLECLKKIYEHSNSQPTFGISFTGIRQKSSVLQRAKYLTTERPPKLPIGLTAVFSLLLLCSVLFIFESFHDDSNKMAGTFSIAENAYIIETDEGLHELYFGDEYIGRLNDPYSTSDLAELPIYKNSIEGEVIRSNEKEISLIPFIVLIVFLLLFCACLSPELRMRKQRTKRIRA